MKYLLLAVLFLFSSFAVAGYCDKSSFTIINNTNEELTVSSIESYFRVYRGALDPYPEEYDNSGRFRNITRLQKISPQSAITAYAFSTDYTAGAIKADIVLVGKNGQIKLTPEFHSAWLGLGDCYTKIEIDSGEYDTQKQATHGAPATAVVEIS